MLRIHFLNVGHGDCTFIEFPSGRLGMIDINNSKALPQEDVVALAENKGLTVTAFELSQASAPIGYHSWEDYYKSLLVDPFEYYRDHLQSSYPTVFRYIQTHPDMDHMSGLFRFFYQEGVGLENFWDTNNKKSFARGSFESSPYDETDWLTYRLLRTGSGRDDSTHRVIKAHAGDSRNYWADDGIDVLSPTKELEKVCDDTDSYNDISYILRIRHAGRSVILPGDAEAAAWETVLEQFGQNELSCDVLKAAHHGRENGYYSDAVDTMSPTAVICSVGKKPSTDASDEYARHGAKVFSTRYNGTITLTIWDDGDLWIEDHNGARLLTLE